MTRCISLSLFCAVIWFTSAEAQVDNATASQAIAAWNGCVHRSFALQRTQVRDDSLAAEQAFMACRSEEQGFLLLFPFEGRELEQRRTMMHIKAKRALLGQQ